MTLKEFFNPYSVEHLKAYRHLEKTGMWPVGFVPEDVDIEPHWQVALTDKMAHAWIEHAEAGHVLGMPSFE